jgi:ribonuclease J
METGIPQERLILAEDGMTVCFEEGTAKIGETVNVGRILVDGKGVGDVDEMVLRDRRRLSGDGVVIVLLAVAEQTGEVIYGPDIVSRGFVFEDQGTTILEEAKCIALEVLDNIENRSHIDWSDVGQEIKREMKRFFSDRIERRPLILPIIMPV